MPKKPKKLHKTGGVGKRGKVIKKKGVTKKRKRPAPGYVVTSALSGATVTQYRRIRGSKAATTSQKRRASEAMGESGAVAYLQERTGNDLDLVHPTKTEPFDLSLDDGTAWDSAIAFNGNGVADVMTWDGETLHVIEAKGGGSTLKKASQFGRIQKYNPDTGDMLPQAVRQSANPPRLSQGTLEYLTDIAHNMWNSKSADNRTDAGRAILDAIENDTIEYVPVSTRVEEGDSTATVSVMDPDEEG